MFGLKTPTLSWSTIPELPRVTKSLANIADSITRTIWSKPANPPTPVLHALNVDKLKVGDVLPNGYVITEDDNLLVVVDEWFLERQSDKCVHVKHEGVVVIGKKNGGDVTAVEEK